MTKENNLSNGFSQEKKAKYLEKRITDFRIFFKTRNCAKFFIKNHLIGK